MSSTSSTLASLPLAHLPPASAAQKEPPTFLQVCSAKIGTYITSSTNLLPELAALIAQYVISHEGAFGTKQWEEHVGYNPGPELPFSDDLLDYWYSADPLDPTRLVCDTHLPPVRSSDLCWRDLSRFITRPKKGPGATCDGVDEPIWRRWRDGCSADVAWFIMRKELPFKGKSYVEQVALLREKNFDPPSFLDVMIVVFLRYVFCEEYYLGGGTYSHCKETVDFGKDLSFQVIVGGFRKNKLCFSLGGDYGNEHIGIVLLRKFSCINKNS